MEQLLKREYTSPSLFFSFLNIITKKKRIKKYKVLKLKIKIHPKDVAMSF